MYPPTNITTGLSTAEYEKSLKLHGKNEVVVTPIPMWKLFISQFIGVMQLILLICAILSASFEDYTDFGIILALVTINGLLAFSEERKSMKALSALTASVYSSITVVRQSESTSINVVDLVPGDIILLVGGVKVPADVRWVKGDKLSIDTAALTGEPLPR